MKDANKIKREKRKRRHIRVKARARGTASKPRLSVFRSNKHIFLQLIDDENRKTIVSVGDFQPKADLRFSNSAPRAGKKTKTKMAKKELAFQAGKNLAELAKKKKIKTAVFDRGGYSYHGRVKAAAEGAREGGLVF